MKISSTTSLTIIALIISFSSFTFPQPAPDTLWTKTFGMVGLPEEASSVSETNDGGYIISAFTRMNGNADLYLVKTDSLGNQLWDKSYGSSLNEYGEDVTQTLDGDYILVGSAPMNYTLVVKTDVNGDTLWTRTLASPTVYYSRVLQSHDENYVVLTSGISTLQLHKIDQGGTILWTKNLPPTYSQGSSGCSFIESFDNGYVIASKNPQYFSNLIKTDSDGNILWEKVISDISVNNQSVKQASDGGYIICGSKSLSQGGSAIQLTKTDNSGNLIWEKEFANPRADGISLDITIDGGYVIAGTTNEPADASIYIMKTDSIGNKKWSKIIEGDGRVFASCIQQTSSHEFILVGAKEIQFPDYDVYLVKLNKERNVNIIIETDSIWLDSDFSGNETKTVDGSQTSILLGNILAYDWLVDGIVVANGSVAQVQLPSGSNYITLRVTTDQNEVFYDSVFVSVYAASLETNGPITSAIGQLSNNIFFATSADDQVYRFDSSGYVNWTILTGGDIQSTTCISNQNNIYVGSSDTRLYAFDSEGTPKWDRAMGGIVISSPSISNDSMIYVGVSTGRLFAVSESGTIQWNYQTGGAINSSPSVSISGDIYVGSDDGKLYSISRSGNLNWSFITVSPIKSSPAIGNDSTVVFGSDDGYVYKLNKSGGLIWSYDAGASVKSSPIIDNIGRIYFGSENGKIYCLTSGGNLIWEYDAGGSIVSSAAFSRDGNILIGSNDGKLLAISDSGDLEWYLQTTDAIQSPILYTNNDLVIFGQNSGSIYVIKNPTSQAYNQQLLAAYEWPTFKGSNRRTGNKLDVVVGVEKEKTITPSEYSLEQCFPNPFNPATTISFSIPKEEHITLKIFNIVGEEIITLVNEEKSVGTYEVTWYAEELPSGVYFYQLRAGEYINTKKMLLIK